MACPGSVCVRGAPDGERVTAPAFVQQSHAAWWFPALPFPFPPCSSLANELKRRRNTWMQASCKCPGWRRSKPGFVAVPGQAGLVSSREQKAAVL